MSLAKLNIVISEKRDDRFFWSPAGVALPSKKGHYVLKLNPGVVLNWELTREEDFGIWLMKPGNIDDRSFD